MSRKTIHIECDEEVWRAARVRAMEEGLTLTALFSQTLHAYAGSDAPVKVSWPQPLSTPDELEQALGEQPAGVRPCKRCDCKDFKLGASSAFRCKCGHPIGDHQR